METITEAEAQESFDSLLDRVETGDFFLITREGKPAARLIADVSTVDHEKTIAAAK